MVSVLKDNLVSAQKVNARKHSPDNALKDNQDNVHKTHRVKDEGCHNCRFCKRWTQTRTAKFPLPK